MDPVAKIIFTKMMVMITIGIGLIVFGIVNYKTDMSSHKLIRLLKTQQCQPVAPAEHNQINPAHGESPHVTWL